MTSDVRQILDSEGCIAEKLCAVFSYQFSKQDNCCSNCDAAQLSAVE